MTETYCWLVELVRDEEERSPNYVALLLPQWADGLERVRPTTNPYEAVRFTNRAEADYFAQGLTCPRGYRWRATDHLFTHQRANRT
jgi:hypothetical protein